MTAKGTPRNRADWPAIEARHNTGKFSDGQLATIFNVARETIVRRRKIDQAKDPRRWRQDLSQQVRQATAALLLRDQVTAEASQVTATVTDGHTAVAILTAAEVAKSVVLGQRSRTERAIGVVMGLLTELETTSADPDKLALMFEQATADLDEKGMSAARQKFRDLMGLHSRVASAQKLVEAVSRAQAVERVAYSLDKDGGSNSQGWEDLVADIEGQLPA